MELNRVLEIGDRVRVLNRAEVEAILDRSDDESFPEADDYRLRFAPSMLQYCGCECVVHEIRSSYPYRYVLRLCETDEVIDMWVWCPSMLEDVTPEQELEPADEDFIRSFFAEVPS